MKKIIKISTFIFVSIFICGSVFSQQIPANNFYVRSPIIINPAATGNDGNLSAFMNYRDQWSGLKGAPEVVRFGVHGFVTDAMGIGIVVSQQKTGIFSTIVSRFKLFLQR